MKKILAVVFSLLVAPLLHAQGVVAVAVQTHTVVVASTSRARVHRYRGFVFAFSGLTSGGLASRPFAPEKIAREAIDEGGSFDEVVGRLQAALYPQLREAVRVTFEFDRVAYWRDLEGHKPVFELMIGGKDSGGPGVYITRYALADDGSGNPVPRPYYDYFLKPGEFGVIGRRVLADELFKTYLSQHHAPPADPGAFVRGIVRMETAEEPGLVGAGARFFTLHAGGL